MGASLLALAKFIYVPRVENKHIDYGWFKKNQILFLLFWISDFTTYKS